MYIYNIILYIIMQISYYHGCETVRKFPEIRKSYQRTVLAKCNYHWYI